MKKLLFMLIAFLVLFVTGCGGQSLSGASPAQPAHNQVAVSLTFNHRDGIAANQFAVWIEDGGGKLIKTLYVTRFTAKGGWKNRPDAIPVWVEKSGIASGSADAHSGATPKKSGQQSYVWDCTDESGQAVPAGEYTFVVEGTIFWKDAVTYTGDITIGGGENSAAATAVFTTDEAKKSDMITDVSAMYKP
jgi:hypothetical protein